MLVGHLATREEQAWPLSAPVITALDAGTFLYFGAMHRLVRAAGPGNVCAPLCGHLITASVAAFA